MGEMENLLSDNLRKFEFWSICELKATDTKEKNLLIAFEGNGLTKKVTIKVFTSPYIGLWLKLTSVWTN